MRRPRRGYSSLFPAPPPPAPSALLPGSPSRTVDEIAGGVLLQQLTGIPRRYASHGQTLPSRSTKGSLLRCLSVRTARKSMNLENRRRSLDLQAPTRLGSHYSYARVHHNASRSRPSAASPLQRRLVRGSLPHYTSSPITRERESVSSYRPAHASRDRPSVAGFHRRMSILCTDAHLLAVATGASRRSRPSEGDAAELMALGPTASPLARSHEGNSHSAHLREKEGGPRPQLGGFGRGPG